MGLGPENLQKTEVSYHPWLHGASEENYNLHRLHVRKSAQKKFIVP